MTTADDETTKAVLDEGGYTYYEGESILAEVDDRPGGMARVARELADAGVNITATCSSGGGGTGDVRLRGRRYGAGQADPRTQGLILGPVSSFPRCCMPGRCGLSVAGASASPG